MQPEMKGGLDPTVLAALPPSMQLDLLVQVFFFILISKKFKGSSI